MKSYWDVEHILERTVQNILDWLRVLQVPQKVCRVPEKRLEAATKPYVPTKKAL